MRLKCRLTPYQCKLSFDKDRLSYQVLLGIKLMHNKSAVFYTDLLCSTLKDDYAIDIVHECAADAQRRV
jgi:hypothetical protein